MILKVLFRLFRTPEPYHMIQIIITIFFGGQCKANFEHFKERVTNGL